MKPYPKLIVLVGETASGKSAIAMQLAEEFNGEIISADSWQVYKGFNIGTAKPTKAEQSQILHHLIDIKTPKEGFSAAEYKKLANKAIAEISTRGKLSILVGGTGLYVDSVLYDYSFLPPGSAQMRKAYNKKAVAELLAEIESKKISLAGVDVRNKRRLIRLLETNGQQPTRSGLRPNSLVLGIKLPRSKLRQNIETRVNTMIRRGLKHEVENLANEYGWDVEPMKGIGYREFAGYFRGSQSLTATKRKIVKSTLDLAKRQRTWFKRHPEILWLEGYAAARPIVEKFLAT